MERGISYFSPGGWVIPVASPSREDTRDANPRSPPERGSRAVGAGPKDALSLNGE
jgi:hypothetical protein